MWHHTKWTMTSRGLSIFRKAKDKIWNKLSLNSMGHDSTGTQSYKSLIFTTWSHLTHWGWVTDTCISKLTIIGSDNGLSHGRWHAIIWTNAGILLIWTLGTNFSEILIEIHIFSFKKMYLKMLSGKWQPFYLGLSVLLSEFQFLARYHAWLHRHSAFKFINWYTPLSL